MEATEGLDSFVLHTESSEDFRRVEWSGEDGALYLVFQERDGSNEGSVLKIEGTPEDIRNVCQAILDASPVSAVVADTDALWAMHTAAKVEALSALSESLKNAKMSDHFDNRDRVVEWVERRTELVRRGIWRAVPGGEAEDVARLNAQRQQEGDQHGHDDTGDRGLPPGPTHRMVGAERNDGGDPQDDGREDEGREAVQG